MVSGRLPFEGEREEAVAYSIVHEEPESITALRTHVSLQLDRIVEKAMVKSPVYPGAFGLLSVTPCASAEAVPPAAEVHHHHGQDEDLEPAGGQNLVQKDAP